MSYSIMSDKDAQRAFEEVKDLMKSEHTDSIIIDYSKLDNITEAELRQSILKVLHKRYNELSSTLNGVGEFVIHNG